MSTIRPSYPQPPQPQAQPPGQRLSGQSALFALARGKPAEASAPAMATPAPPSADRTSEAASVEPPRKLLRPGSLLDIRV